MHEPDAALLRQIVHHFNTHRGHAVCVYDLANHIPLPEISTAEKNAQLFEGLELYRRKGDLVLQVDNQDPYQRLYTAPWSLFAW